VVQCTELPRELYIRQCYEELGDIVARDFALFSAGKPHRKVGAIVIGTPGIGKRGFAWYLLDRFLADGVAVVYHSSQIWCLDEERGVHVLFRPGGTIEVTRDYAWIERVEPTKVVLIVDNMAASSVPCFAVVISNAQRELYKQFLKDSEAYVSQLYMPV
jgi:hypothetical protein